MTRLAEVSTWRRLKFGPCGSCGERPDSRGRVWWPVGRGHESPGHGVCLPGSQGRAQGLECWGPTESPPGAPSAYILSLRLAVRPAWAQPGRRLVLSPAAAPSALAEPDEQTPPAPARSGLCPCEAVGPRRVRLPSAQSERRSVTARAAALTRLRRAGRGRLGPRGDTRPRFRAP